MCLCFFLLPELSLTVMLLMSETPLCDCFILVAVNKWSTPDDSLAGVESPVRAGCDRAASQLVQLVDYLTLDSRSNFQEKVAISKPADSFDGSNCAANCLVENEWKKL